MKDYLEILNSYKEDLIKDLGEIVAIKSVAEEGNGDTPHGKSVARVFAKMLEIGERDGFTSKNVDNQGGHIEWKGTDESAGIFALLGHLDVVPEGSNWDTNPYILTKKDGKLYGRGAIDDKGPTMAAYYAMKALKDAGFQPKKSIRLILGLNEETTWSGMKYYMSHETIPNMGFAPDADFPCINREKGLIEFQLIKKLDTSEETGIHLVSIKGGTAPNMVADHAVAVIKGIDLTQKINDYKLLHPYDIECTYMSEVSTITVNGVSAHGAMPELGVNAITILCEALGNVNFDNEDVKKFIDFYNDTIGFNYHGEKFGCYLEDEPSGKLNFNVGMLDIDHESEIKLTINIRYPVTYKEEDVYNGIDTINTDYEIVKTDHLAPLYVPADHPLVEVLMDVYREFTGDKESEPLAIGGATYARSMPNCVAFGPVFPGEESVEHQPNEFINIENMMKAAEMYCEAIYRLCKM